MSYPITWKPAASTNFATGRAGKVPQWLVHHRMVGYLTGTDRHFAKTGVQVSTHFGIGRRVPGGPIHISQYVALDDRAFGNGNNVDSQGREVASEWNRFNFPSRPNEHTISIEHEDGASSTDADGKRGVVDDAVIEASIWLDKLLLTGDPAKLRAAGIRFRSDDLVRALARLPRDERHIIDHHFIAGPLKPYCWQRWLDDKGFPQARYLAALGTGDDMPGLKVTLIGDRAISGIFRSTTDTGAIYLHDREGRDPIDAGRAFQALGTYARDFDGAEGYVLTESRIPSWVPKGGGMFTPDAAPVPAPDPTPQKYAVTVGGKPAGEVTLP